VVLPCLSTGGRVLVIGVGGGATAAIDLRGLMSRRTRISGSTLRARTSAERAVVVAALEAKVLPLLAAGRLRVPVSETFPLGRAADAYERFAARGRLGKIVLLS
jgi:NADPH:quinone reductase-like Zn-dependent oxidoreductase